MSIVERRDAERLRQQPGPDERGLPNHFFTDPQHFELERKLLFQRSWVFVGVVGELKGPGSVMVREAAGVPLIVTCPKEGVIRVFQNVCPHRGASLVGEDREGGKLMVCPYHAWSFDLDGVLRARPHYYGIGLHGTPRDGDREDCKGLFEVRTAVWNGAILVNIDGKAPPIEEYLADLDAQTEGYDLSQMRYSDVIESDFNSNWKLTIENWLDSYHVFAVHPGLDKMMVPDQRKAAVGAGWLVYADYFNTEVGKSVYGGLPAIEGLPEEMKTASFFAAQFPNWAVSVHPTYLLFWNYIPVAVDKTRVQVFASFVGDAATSEEHAQARQDLLSYYAGLNEEDMGVCSLMQKGRAAPAYDGGRFSPYWDGGSVHFARNVQRAMLEERE